jgi:hypothetical protein
MNDPQCGEKAGNDEEARGMGNILFSSPLVQLYLLHVAVLLLLACWPGKANPTGSEDGRGCVQGICRPRMRADGGPRLPARRLPGVKEGDDLLPVRDLAAVCSAKYSAQFSTAVKRIRMW